MEALVFLVDAIGIVILVITSLRNDRRSPGEPMIGPFRYHEKVDPDRGKRAPLPYMAGRAAQPPRDGG